MQQEARHSTEQALHDYKMGVGKFSEKLPEVTKTFNAFTEACFG